MNTLSLLASGAPRHATEEPKRALSRFWGSVSGLGATSESLEHNYQEMVIHNVTYSVLMKLWLVELLIRI